MENTFVTVRTYNCSINAHLDRMKLEAAGVDCFLLDEQTDDSTSAWVGVLVNLLVRESDVESASHILCSGGDASTDEIELTEFDLEVDSSLRDAS